MRGEFHKIRRLPPYVFEQVNRRKAELRAEGADIIDLGMGNPDLPTPPKSEQSPRHAKLVQLTWNAKIVCNCEKS